ncbi:MAG: glycosyltransferase [Hyphomicrobium zavarzinii]|uniref:ceramide glucosyltransferase n=1 Tax=Hyphomicrobium zavarzinii TaxID=48292 RepID=UPI001A554082|nr:ceramide glucosyltransferase [Hyphomicrobium zavarzinii]MBL8845100.1 glycosyltransferase [Hyphomicrobium zavarzinii]
MIEWAALVFCTLATLVHIASAAMSLWRVRQHAAPAQPPRSLPPVSIIRPVCGLDPYDELTLRSTFELAHPDLDLVFCSARERDAAVPLVRQLMAEYPHVSARLLIGDDKSTPNPKLNNIIKGWVAARHRWIVIADSNVLMPADYVHQLMAAMRSDTGLACSPPIGSRPSGFWSEVECAFLNTYQARWQLAADTAGFGFAQGKSMLWRKDLLDAAGGIRALGVEIAEDAAATKVVRAEGLRVRLVDAPFEQPLGPRSKQQVLDRQIRWARLRRATFPLCYMPELLTGSVLPVISAALAAPVLEIDSISAAALMAALWFGVEALLARGAGWHVSAVSPVAWLVRDLVLPLVWLKGWTGDGFTWRGNDMTVAEPEQTRA